MANKTKLFLGGTLTALSLLGGVSCEASDSSVNSLLQEISKCGYEVLHGNAGGVGKLVELARNEIESKNTHYALDAVKTLNSLPFDTDLKSKLKTASRELTIALRYKKALDGDPKAVSLLSIFALSEMQKGAEVGSGMKAVGDLYHENTSQAIRNKLDELGPVWYEILLKVVKRFSLKGDLRPFYHLKTQMGISNYYGPKAMRLFIWLSENGPAEHRSIFEETLKCFFNQDLKNICEKFERGQYSDCEGKEHINRIKASAIKGAESAREELLKLLTKITQKATTELLRNYARQAINEINDRTSK